MPGGAIKRQPLMSLNKITTEQITWLIDTLRPGFYLLVGWLMGLLSPLIVDAIRRRRERKEIKQAIITELQELQYRLASGVYLTTLKLGKGDREFFKWFLPILERYEGPLNLDVQNKYAKDALKLTDEQLTAVLEHSKNEDLNKGMTLKKYYAPLLDANIAHIGSFSVEFQNLLLTIHSRLGIINEQIDQYYFYFKETFNENLSTHNRTIITNNIDQCYAILSQQGRMTCDLINKLLKL